MVRKWIKYSTHSIGASLAIDQPLLPCSLSVCSTHVVCPVNWTGDIYSGSFSGFVRLDYLKIESCIFEAVQCLERAFGLILNERECI